jgi:hypothetical protein
MLSLLKFESKLGKACVVGKRVGLLPENLPISSGPSIRTFRATDCRTRLAAASSFTEEDAGTAVRRSGPRCLVPAFAGILNPLRSEVLALQPQTGASSNRPNVHH